MYKRQTGISILKDGKVIYTDDEATGGSHMTMTVAGHYKIPYEEAEVLKTTPELSLIHIFLNHF